MLNNALLMLIGAAVAGLGVLASALADRIRGLRTTNTRATDSFTGSRSIEAPRERRPAAPARAIEVADAELVPDPPTARRGSRLAEPGADDVIAALVAAGYKKQVATEAVWACGRGERATIESWTAAALRRCARGAAS